MRLLRRLTILISLLAVLAAGLWLAAATLAERGLRAALTAPDSVLSAADVQGTGFPGPLHLRLDRPVLTDPNGTWVWTAPTADVSVSLPARARLNLPRDQVIMLGGAAIPLRAEAMRADLTLAPRPDLRLRRVALHGQAIRLGGADQPLAQAAQIDADLTQGRGEPVSDLTLALRDVTLPPALTALLPDASLPAAVSSLDGVARLHLDRPLDRQAGNGAPLRLMAVELMAARLEWGPLSVSAEGRIAADAQGQAEGRVMLRLTGWRALLPLLSASGAVRPQLLPTVENALTRLETTPPEGGPPRLDLPLILANGRASLGPLPLGPAPQFWVADHLQ
ncbi:DUF2125 domain-containing protein [Paracoccus sp. p3-h83]|uniref:DUF2125 domain-containing protein n=1 Tax=Paracoccus sp. p3-h83 TaxID=3342805 RepID=UPI0035BBBD83